MHSPRKLLTSLTFCGFDQFVTTTTFSGSVATPYTLTTWPRNLTLHWKSSHFFEINSTKHLRSSRILSNNRSKVAGALHRLKAITLNCHSLLPAVKVVFSRSCSSTSTCPYPLLRFRVENQLEPDKSCLPMVKDTSPSWSARLISGSQRKIWYHHPFSSSGLPVKPMGWPRFRFFFLYFICFGVFTLFTSTQDTSQISTCINLHYTTLLHKENTTTLDYENKRKERNKEKKTKKRGIAY